MRRKIIPPLPESDEFRHDRFKRFAKAIFPKSEIATPEQLIAHLKAEKRELENRIAEMRQGLAKRKQSIQKVH